MAHKVTIGLDVGTATTRIAVIEHTKGSNSQIIATGKSETSGMRQGYVVNQNEAVKSILRVKEEVERKANVQIKHATLSFGGISLESSISPGSAIISKANNEVTSLDIEKAIADSRSNLTITNRHILHEIPVEFTLDSKEVFGNPEGMRGVKLEVKTLFITVLTHHYENLVATAEIAGIEVTDVVALPLATSMIVLNDKQRNAGCALVDIGSETTSIAVFEEGNVISISVISMGGNNVTNDIALGLQIPIEDAERVKTGHIIGDFPKKQLDEIIEARLTDIFELVRRHLKKIHRDRLLPAGIIIIGGGSRSKNIEDLAKKILKLPARIGTPRVFAENKASSNDTSWTTVYGLCLLGKFTSTNALSGELGIWKTLKEGVQSLLKQLMP